MTDRGRWERYWRFLTSGFRPDVRDEIDFHVEQRARVLMEEGQSPEAARREAERRLGDRARLTTELERMEEKRGRRLARAFSIAELAQDLRYGVRGLARRPVFTLTAAASLAFGIATTTVAFSLVDTLMLRPLPIRKPHELVIIGGRNDDGLGGPNTPLPAIRELARRTDLFSEVAADRLNLAGIRAPGAAQAEGRIIRMVTGNWFQLLGVSAAVGRTITPEDETQHSAVVMLDHDFWVQRLGGDPSVIGANLMMNGVAFTIIGVTPRGFRGMQPLFAVAAYLPSSTESLLSPNAEDIGLQWESGTYLPVARRQPGQSIEQVRAALLVMSRTLRAEHPAIGEKFEWGAETENVSRVSYAAAEILPVIGAVFFGLAALVLLTACVNVTSLVLTRAAGRRSELAVRQAMGASRTRLARQLLTETVLIAVIGLVGAWGLAWATIRALGNLPVGFDVPIRLELAFDARVFGLASLAALVAGLLAGIAPAITGTRDGPSGALREGGGKGAAGGIRTQKFRTALVGAQVAVSVTLLTAAALFVQSTRRAARIDLGFHPERILTVTFNPAYTLRNDLEIRQAFDRIIADVRALPAVESAAWASALPLFRSNFSGPVFVDDPAARTDRTGSVVASYVAVSPEYLATLDIPLIAGRGITAEDDSVHPLVAVVNKRAAEIMWPGKDPIGQHLRFERDGAPVEVVGVTRDGRYNFILEPPTPFIYLPQAQRSPGEAFLAVRATTDAHSLDAPIRAVFAAANPDFVPAGFLALSDVIHDGPNAMLLFRLGAVSASVLGAVSLFLTLVGLFGVMSVGVTQRTRELGVRLALGATPSQVRRGVLRQAAVLAGLGVLAGVPVALLTVSVMRSLIVGMTTRDMLVVGVVAGMLVLSAMAAAYPSALRASRLNPVGALRSE